MTRADNDALPLAALQALDRFQILLTA